MKVVNNNLTQNMISILKNQIGKELISFKYNYHFDEKNTADSAGIDFLSEDSSFILFSDLKYFDILDGEDYSYMSVYDNTDTQYKKLKDEMRKEVLTVGQIINDILIVTDTYHFTNSKKGINEKFICDYALIFILDNKKICFEKFDIFENDLEISKINLSDKIKLFDNSQDFDNPKLYKTQRFRTIRSLKE